MLAVQNVLQDELLRGSEIGKQRRHQPNANSLDVAAKLVMKVSYAENDPLVQERLFAAALPGARGGRLNGGDIQLLNCRLAAVLLQKVIERAKFVGELGLAHPSRKAEIQLSPAEDAGARPHCIEAQAGMW